VTNQSTPSYVLNLLNGTGVFQKSAAGDVADGGPTEHPSKEVDNGTVSFSEGPRSKENEAGVKSIAEAVSVESSGDATPPSGAGKLNSQLQAMQVGGVRASATGDDPSVEDDYKDKPDDPGTSAPASVDDTRKYGHLLEQPTVQLANFVFGRANDALALVAKAAALEKSTKTAASAAPAAPQPDETTLEDQRKYAEAGYNLAAQSGLAPAADYSDVDLIEASIKEAHWMADLTAQAVFKVAAGLDPNSDGEDEGPPPDDGSGGGGPPMGDPSMGGGGPPPMGGGGPPPDAGGPPMGDPAMGGGPPDAGGAPDKGQLVHEIASAMVEMGVSPEEIIAAMQSAAGGAGGPGGPPDAGGDPSKQAYYTENEDVKLIRAAADYRRSGRFSLTPPTTSKQAELRGRVRHYIAEVVNGR
jgi:hypothetical protein